VNETIQRIMQHATEMIREARDASTFAERAALYALARVYGRDLEEVATDDFGDDAYLREKASYFQWRMGAALGFDADNGHYAEQHRVWALGALSQGVGAGRAIQLRRTAGEPPQLGHQPDRPALVRKLGWLPFLARRRDPKPDHQPQRRSVEVQPLHRSTIAWTPWPRSVLLAIHCARPLRR
jgi:hypothetical protein